MSDDRPGVRPALEVLAIIPARGGSKGIPGKNLRELGGVPLLAWSIQAAHASNRVTRVVVSSDAEDILHAAEAWGAEALRRPPELATDTAATDAVLIHVVEELGRSGGYRPDAVVLLQPTVPLRPEGLVDRCVAALAGKGLDFVFTATPLHFVWWRETPGPDTDGRTWATQCPRRPRRQDMVGRERMVHEDGSVYVTRTDFLLHHGARLWVHGATSRVDERAPRMEVIETDWSPDIDTARDLAVAAALAPFGGIVRPGVLTERAG